MPFRDPKNSHFGVDSLKVMQAAFDGACLNLNLSENDPRRTQLAAAIAKLAMSGDMQNLQTRAIEAMKA